MRYIKQTMKKLKFPKNVFTKYVYYIRKQFNLLLSR
jgi:hypothetical protein